jgi:hypothetical protein
MTGGTYELRLRSPVSAQLLVELGVTYQSEEPAQTVLCTDLVDQAAVHGLLNRVRALGLELLEIRRIPDGGYGSSGQIP